MNKIPSHIRDILLQRISARTVEVDRGFKTPCHEYQGARDADGYGKIKVGKDVERTHRVVFMCSGDERGFELLDGELVRHRCDNPHCCRPDHLERGTHLDNMRDMVDRGRHKGNDKLTADQVKEIRSAKIRGTMTVKRLAAKYGVSESTISAVLSFSNRADSLDCLFGDDEE